MKIVKFILIAVLGYYAFWGIALCHLGFHCVGQVKAPNLKGGTHYLVFRMNPFWRLEIPIFDLKVPAVITNSKTE